MIDSSAWIEYLEGSSIGEKVRKIILENEEIYSSSIILGEIVSVIKRREGNWKLAYEVINSVSKFIDLTPKISMEAGIFHAEMKKKKRNFGLADAFILTSAREAKAELVTSDDHFRGFKEVLFLK